MTKHWQKDFCNSFSGTSTRRNKRKKYKGNCKTICIYTNAKNKARKAIEKLFTLHADAKMLQTVMSGTISPDIKKMLKIVLSYVKAFKKISKASKLISSQSVIIIIIEKENCNYR